MDRHSLILLVFKDRASSSLVPARMISMVGYSNSFSGGARWKVSSVAISNQFFEPSTIGTRV